LKCDMRSLVLTGEASEEFARRLFCPTKEEVEERRKFFDKLDEDIIIYETEDGFIAECKNLDLSEILSTDSN